MSGEAMGAVPPGHASLKEESLKLRTISSARTSARGFSPNVTSRVDGDAAATFAASLSPCASSMLTTATRGTGPTPPVKRWALTSK